MKKRIICLVLCTIFISGIGTCLSSAKDPAMQYQYTLEKRKVEQAQYIWNEAIEVLRKKDILTNEDISNINEYLRIRIISDKIESPEEKCERQKNALKLSTINDMVNNRVITTIKGEKLRIQLCRYNLYKFVN